MMVKKHLLKVKFFGNNLRNMYTNMISAEFSSRGELNMGNIAYPLGQLSEDRIELRTVEHALITNPTCIPVQERLFITGLLYNRSFLIGYNSDCAPSIEGMQLCEVRISSILSSDTLLRNASERTVLQ